jgi:CRP/FNR family cyclic AMP-dependent transcriptional regulator
VGRPFRIVADEASEESGELLFMPDASAADWAKIFAVAERLAVDAGLAVLQAGERDRALYLITEGTLAVRLPHAESAFKTIEAPAVVGELAFFDGGPRSATLEALTDVEVARLDAGAFERLSAAEPELARRMLLDLARILAGRLRRASDLISDLRE